VDAFVPPNSLPPSFNVSFSFTMMTTVVPRASDGLRRDRFLKKRPALFRKIICERSERFYVNVGWQHREISSSASNVRVNCRQRLANDAVAEDETEQMLLFLLIISENHRAEFLSGFRIDVLQQQQKWQRQFSLLHVCSKRFTGQPFLTKNIHAIVINLVRDPQIGAVFMY